MTVRLFFLGHLSPIGYPSPKRHEFKINGGHIGSLAYLTLGMIILNGFSNPACCEVPAPDATDRDPSVLTSVPQISHARDIGIGPQKRFQIEMALIYANRDGGNIFLQSSNADICPPEPFSKQARPNILRVQGEIAYRDLDGRAILLTDQRRVVIESRFAHLLPLAETLVVRGTFHMDSKTDLAYVRAWEIKQRAQALLPPAPNLTIAHLNESSSLPLRVTTKGTLISAKYHGTNYRLLLQEDGRRVRVDVPEFEHLPDAFLSNFVLNSEIELGGVPLRVDQMNLKEAGLTNPIPTNYVPTRQSIHALRLPDAATQSTSFPVDGLIGTASFFALVIALVIGLKNLRLRRRMSEGTERFTEIDTHIQATWASIRCALLIIDTDGKTVRVNQHFEDLFGFSPKPGRTFATYFGEMESAVDSFEAFAGQYEACLRDTPDHSLQTELTLSNGERCLQLFTTSIILEGSGFNGRLFVFEDVTESRLMETKLIRAQKMEAVGRLSGGIAHDFNNYLTVIQSSVEYMSARLEYDDDVCRMASAAIEKASCLTRQLLGFAGRNQLLRSHVAVSSLLSDLRLLVRGLEQPNKTIHIDCSDDETVLYIDKNQIEQVILNLCANAIDALDLQRGVVRVQGDTVTDENMGNCWCLRVSDNGSGIREELHEKIFDPFFTTKDVDKGTGLGLSVADGIIRQHGGRIDFRSKPGNGSIFEVFLPVSDQVPASSRLAVTLRDDHADPSLGILLVDDEPLVRQSAEALLSSMGHEVETADNGMQALVKLARQPNLDLVILDVVMPEMSGVETLHEIRSQWPDLPVILCSVYAPNEFPLDDDMLARHVLRLSKPFTMEELREAIALSIHLTDASPMKAAEFIGQGNSSPLI